MRMISAFIPSLLFWLVAGSASHAVLDEHKSFAYQDSTLFSRAVEETRRAIDAEILEPIDVPLPQDAGGGYTHEQHKRNYKSIYDAGRLYAVTGEEKYADYAKRLLFAYADLYPTLGEHPKKKEQTPGRLFWQSLNESVWLVVSIQGYDAIKSALTEEERERIETGVLRPVASFLSEGAPETFNKIHNHGTWATAAVGMTGYVLDDHSLVEKALYGLDLSGQGGFMRQLDELFSPTGYYSEGPYYQRYALMPFVLFAAAIEANQPERKIFEYRDGILKKAIYSTIQLSYGDFFFPINDALKDKGLNTMELMHASSIAFDLTGDKSLLPIVGKQSALPLTEAGLKVALAMEAGAAEPFDYKSMLHMDGVDGRDGSLAVLRTGSGDDHQALVMKNTAQGMGHGHFDKLGWLYYDAGHEVILDYGAARFLNVEAKNGGHYLPENKSWAKQTVAHNTLVVDETSHFDGKTDVGEQYQPEQLLFAASDKVQLSAAHMEGAYDDVSFTRLLATITDATLDFPIVLDVLKASAGNTHQYDLPLHYSGHLTDTSVELESNSSGLKPLGDKNGYQHLWLKARGRIGEAPASVTWIKDKRFYTYTTLTPEGSELLFTQLGANDPNFNLRPENSVITRVPSAGDALLASVLEPHGIYNPALEFTLNSHSQIAGLKRVSENGLDLILIETAPGTTWVAAISWNVDPDTEHTIQLAGQTISWHGFASIHELNSDHFGGENDG